MQVIKNQPVIKKLSETLSNNELSNVTMVIESPTLLSIWYLVDPDRSTLVPGTRNVHGYIGPESQVVFNRYTGVPIGGVSDLTTQAQYDEEVGYDESFQSQGIVYPNTIYPIPGSFFVLKDAQMTAVYVVTNITPTTVRSNPFMEFTFQLYSRNPEDIKQLERQVYKRYQCATSTIGTNKSLVMLEDSIDSINHHVEEYTEMCFMFKSLFYDNNAAAFVFDGLPDYMDNRAKFIDMTLWRMMFDERIIIFDDIISYAIANGLCKSDRIYTACPDIMVDEHTYHRSILYQILTKNTKGTFDEYRYPYIWKPTERLTKFQGINIWYLEGYQKYPCKDVFPDFYLWDADFLCRIRNNNPYDVNAKPEIYCRPSACDSCTNKCCGEPVTCINPYLRNIIINWLNDQPIDFDLISIVDAPTIENYYLIPLVLGIYKQYISQLRDAGTSL